MAATGSGRAPGPDKGSPCPRPADGDRPDGPAAAAPVDRPPAAGEPAVLAGEGDDPGGAAFVAEYRGEVYQFRPGSWARFGRDDTCVQITVWEQLLGTDLSRTAGEMWCLDTEEVWVRNLSTAHELVVSGADGRPQLLGPRREGQRGRACSVPVPEGTVSAPSTGDWSITVRRTAGPAHDTAAGSVDDPARTRTVGPVPADLAAVAAALCAPVLTRSGPPASYEQVAAALGLTSRQARRRVDRLCDHYREQAPELFAAGAPGHSSYAPVAELLVDRGRVTRADLALLEGCAQGRG